MPNVTRLPVVGASVQAEQQDARAVPATPEDVDLYVDSHSPGVVDCRERNRHPFPTIPVTGMAFDDLDGDLFVRHIPCPSCGCAVRTEWWEWVGRGKYGRMVFITAKVRYRRNANGERYQAPPGHGRISSRAVKESRATRAMTGESITALRKALRRQRRNA